jgi:hypothetical protein
MEIDHVRRFAQQVIVQSRLLDTAPLQGIDYSRHLDRQQDQIAH